MIFAVPFFLSAISYGGRALSHEEHFSEKPIVTIGLYCPLCKVGTLSYFPQNGTSGTKLGIFSAAKCAGCNEEMLVGLHPLLGHALADYFVRHAIPRWRAILSSLFPGYRERSEPS